MEVSVRKIIQYVLNLIALNNLLRIRALINDILSVWSENCHKSICWVDIWTGKSSAITWTYKQTTSLWFAKRAKKTEILLSHSPARMAALIKALEREALIFTRGKSSWIS